jgi:hypothetical protein
VWLTQALSWHNRAGLAAWRISPSITRAAGGYRRWRLSPLVRRLLVRDAESYAVALDRNELGVLLVAAGLGPSPGQAARKSANRFRNSLPEPARRVPAACDNTRNT